MIKPRILSKYKVTIKKIDFIKTDKGKKNRRAIFCGYNVFNNEVLRKADTIPTISRFDENRIQTT